MKSQRLRSISLVILLLVVVVIFGFLAVACSSGCGTKTYTLTYTAGTGGSTSGASTQTVNCSVSGTAITAVADSCYRFINWSDGATTASRTDTNVRNDITVNANFAPNGSYTLTYNAGAGGSISGSSSQTVACGTSGLEVTAVPNACYHFVNWSDDSTVNPRTDIRVTNNITTTANFVINASVISNIKVKISKIVVGRANGSTIQLLLGSPRFDEIAEEAIRIALATDSRCNCMFDFQTVEELSKLNRDFVYIFFKWPTNISVFGGLTEFAVNELILWPEGSPPSPQPLIWTSCKGSECAGWGSSRSMDVLGDLIDNLKD